jgi:hypothetical protein
MFHLCRPQEVMMRKRPPPPTKDGSNGERLDTNTFVSQVCYLNIQWTLTRQIETE